MHAHHWTSQCEGREKAQSPLLQRLMELVPAYHMSLIIRDQNVKVTEEVASQNASGRCKHKEIITHKLLHTDQFSPSEAVSVLHQMLQILTAKEAHQSQKAREYYYGISTIRRSQVQSERLYSTVAMKSQLSPLSTLWHHARTQKQELLTLIFLTSHTLVDLLALTCSPSFLSPVFLLPLVVF